MEFSPRAPLNNKKLSRVHWGVEESLWECFVFSAGMTPASWPKGPAAGLGYKQKK